MGRRVGDAVRIEVAVTDAVSVELGVKELVVARVVAGAEITVVTLGCGVLVKASVAVANACVKVGLVITTAVAPLPNAVNKPKIANITTPTAA